MEIYNRAGELKMAVEPESSSTQSEEIQGDKVLSLGFSNHSCVNIDVDDYCEFLGERYTAFEAYERRRNRQWSGGMSSNCMVRRAS